jgi:hypothetical protein
VWRSSPAGVPDPRPPVEPASPNRHEWAARRGALTTAAGRLDELETIIDATGSGFEPYGGMALAAYQRHEAQAGALIEARIGELESGGRRWG